MGIPKFFRYISERYPCLSELVKEFQIPDFDNLYLDMNGIIHVCSHPNDFEPYFSITEEKIFACIFHYIEVLFNLIKPRKLFFMAVDGVAPRAKMNQQRARRFRTAKDAEMKEKEALRKTKVPLPTDRFDSNCITPGTVFMDHLHSQLKYFVMSKISTDPLWQNCKIILSGHQTPGEGEHKIMDYIRYLKTQPDYDENTRHCLYGLDADLIMLGLCTHEPHFSLLREKVKFSSQSNKKVTSPDETEFYLLHLSLLREYLDLEFQELKDKLPFQYNLENIIDDWVLMGFLVGNDFIPSLPDLHINKDALPILYKAYKEVLPTLDGYLNENGYLNLPRFEQYMERMAKFDLEMFEDTFANLAFLEEKTGRAFTTEKKVNGCLAIKSDLEELIKATEEFELSDEESLEEHHDADEDTFLWEFSQHKKNYYTDKLDYRQVTPEVLKSQAEGYIRAVQWNLHYYYQGCQSWSWFYPHHYAPYISDIRDFKDLKLDFEMGKPFQPFEQLLAVLPAASQALLPEPYRYLMTSPDSPIIDFYPEDFETDLNGKQRDWEAIVLIPFIDEKRLLKAMKEPNEKLTPEEIRRNQHGPMHVFTYTAKNLGQYKPDKYFPSIPANHALMVDVSREEIAVDKSKLQYGLRPGVLQGVLYPGFPTLKHIPFTASLEVAKVKVFESISRGENMLLKLSSREFPPLEELAKDLLGKIVYINWPHLAESRAIAVSDGQVRYSITENDCLVNETLSKSMQKQWMGDVEDITRIYTGKLGVEIGPVEVVVYAALLEGRKCAFGAKGKIANEKVWSARPTATPLQVIVRDIPIQDHRTQVYADLKDAFPVNSVVFMLGQPHFGSMGRVLDSTDCLNNSRLKVAFEVVSEPLVEESLTKSLPKLAYFPLRIAACKAGVNGHLFSWITGAVFVSLSKKDDGRGGGVRMNIGLNMKFVRKNEELPGYTKKEKESWLFSMAAISIVCEYVKKFSRVIEFLASQSRNDIFVEDIFPGVEGLTEMKEMMAWVKEQEHSKVERTKCGTERLEPEVVARLESLVEKQPKKCSVLQLKVKPQLLYKNDLVFGNVLPVKSAKHCLFDRVVSIRSSYTVPTGLRGYIVGIHPAPTESDYLYDILFDQPFLGGFKLNTSEEKVFRMASAFFLNITDANRMSVKFSALRLEPITNSISLRPCHGERNMSAFAQWNHRPPPQPSQDVKDEFKEMWLNLQRAKPQEDALKKILKINKEEKPDIEEPVKCFFEKITKGSIECPRTAEKVALNPFEIALQPKNRYYLQLLSLHQKRNLGQPNVQYLYMGGKVMAQVIIGDGRVYSGLPCEDKDSACESASFQALGALGEVLFTPEDQFVSRPKYYQPQMKPRGPNHKRVPQANNRMPALLPSPPSQWVVTNPGKPHQPMMHCPQRENMQHRWRHEAPARPQDTSNRVNRKLNASALEFVPLQAITGKRNSGKVTTTNHVSKQWTAPEKKTAVVATFFNKVGTSPSVSKPKRRPKIAAKLDFDPNLY